MHGRRVQRPGHPQRPGVGATPLREFGALQVVVQPGTPTGQAPAWIGYDRRGPRWIVLRTVRCGNHAERIRCHDDPEQFGSRGALPASDARSDRALDGHHLVTVARIVA